MAARGFGSFAWPGHVVAGSFLGKKKPLQKSRFDVIMSENDSDCGQSSRQSP